MEKVLYFEGAGLDGTGGEVGNCRIRTALTNDEGTRYYVELYGGSGYGKEWHRWHPGFEGFEYIGFVESCHEITGDPEDGNKRRHPSAHERCFAFTVSSILRFVNEQLGCSFDRVEIAPWLSGYRAIGEAHGTYNFGDEFVLDLRTTLRAQEIEKREMQRQRDAEEKHPCVRVWRDKSDPNLLHVSPARRGFEGADYRLDSDDWQSPIIS